MMSIRSVARSAPRALGRISMTASGRVPVASRASSLLRAPSTFLKFQQTSAFSTSQFRRSDSGEVDKQLASKLESELQFEKDVKDNEPTSASIKDFLENSPFELQDTPGKEEVLLTRTFGNEKITVSFSIADLASQDQEGFGEDDALSDNLEDGEVPSRSQGGQDARNSNDLMDEVEEELADDSDGPMPCRLNVTIEKSNTGALNIEAIVQDGTIVLEQLFYFPDAKLARGGNAELSYKAQDVYAGPPFGSLDEDLQVLMERYLEERGVNQALALFVPDYMDMKEQKEYVGWLNNVKSFVEA